MHSCEYINYLCDIHAHYIGLSNCSETLTSIGNYDSLLQVFLEAPLDKSQTNPTQILNKSGAAISRPLWLPARF